MKTITAENSKEWLAARYGSVGGSDIAKFKTKPRSGDWTDPQWEFIAQAFFEPFVSNAQRGTALEIEALQALAGETLLENIEGLNNIVWQKEGSALHCSPDAVGELVGVGKIGIETKCLSAGKHLRAFLDSDKDFGDYNLQCANYLYSNEELTGVYLVYYCPEARDVPKVIIKTARREEMAEELEFLENLDEAIQEYRANLEKEIKVLL